MFEKHDVHEEEIIANEELEVHDEVELEEEEGNYVAKLKTLREKLRMCEEGKQKHLEDLQRARADFLNSRRRLEEQSLKDKERATDKLILELLTLADSFTMAMNDKDWETLDAKWKHGIEAIEAKLTSILKSTNVTSVNPIGETFNPEEHEAVGNAPVEDDAQVDHIITVLQKGYKRGDDMLRPARVIVGTK